MKVSVSLPAADVEYLDAYARERGLESRSAALRQAVSVLRTAELGAAYEGAWEGQPADDPETADWDVTVGDGLRPGGRDR